MPPCTYRSLIMLLIFIGALHPAHAQTTLSGRVVNTIHTPLPAAVITIQSLPDSTLLKTALTDSNGAFKATAGGTAKQYLVKVMAEGYKPEYRIAVRDETPMLFTLERVGGKLSGVAVSARKRLIERRADRSIFNVDASIAAAGSDAFELLRKAPGIQVNGTTISIAGKSTVSVMVNDRLVQLSGEELAAYLRSMPAEQLSRIEVITTPPAKYDAEGNSGLINIVTKKGGADGLNGNISGHYSQHIHGMYGLNGMFNYRKGAWNAFGNGNAYNGYIQPLQGTTTLFPATRMEQVTELKTQNVFNRLTLGIDYALNEKMVIGLLGILGNGGWSYNADETQTTRAINTRTGALDSTLVTAGHNTDRGLRKVLNLNWEWKIDTTGKKLSVDLETFSRIGDRTRNFTTAQYLPDGTATGAQSDNRTGGRQDVAIRFAKADVVWPSSLANFSFGGKASLIHTISDNLFSYLAAGEYVTDYGKTNSFDYREATQALYISAVKTLGKWEGEAGLRGEYTQTWGYSPTLGRDSKNEYFQLFPTAYVQYNHNEAHAFNLAYSRRIERPSFWIMNPFRTYFTALSYTEGNPFLQPSFNNNLELSYTLRSRYRFYLYGARQHSMFMNINVLDTTTNSYHFILANIGKAASYGLSSDLSLAPATWWECNMQGSGYYREFRSDFYGQNSTQFDAWSVYLQAANTFTLNKSKTLIAQLSLSYNTPQQDGFDRRSAQGEVSAGIRALFLNKTLTLSLNADDIFLTNGWRITNEANGTTQDFYFDQRQLRLALSWKFGSSNIKPKRERTTGSDESARAR
jgi:hypothetical protein